MGAVTAIWRTPDRRYWTFAGLLAVYWAAHLGDQARLDFRVYRMGASVLAHHGALYDPHFIGDDVLTFTYPPFAAFVMMPFAALPTHWAAYTWNAVSTLALAAILRASTPEPWARRWLLLCAALVGCLGLEPVNHGFKLGQINPVLIAVIVLDLLGTSHPARGFFLGLAAGMKLTPLFFFPFLLITRQWSALRNACAGFATSVIVGIAMAPHESWRYWSTLTQNQDRVGDAANVANQSVMGLLFRIVWHGDAPWVRPAWFAACAVIAVISWELARRHWDRGDRPGALAICALGSLFASPISWSHHWVWVIPLGIALLTTIRRRCRHAVWAVGAGVLWFGWFELGLIWHQPYTRDREFHWTLPQALIGNSYIILGLLALTYLSYASWRQPRPPVPPPGGPDGGTGEASPAEPAGWRRRLSRR